MNIKGPLEAASEHVSYHMDEILKAFKPGAQITVIVRTPGHNDADFMMTSDDPSEALALIQRRLAGGAS